MFPCHFRIIVSLFTTPLNGMSSDPTLLLEILFYLSKPKTTDAQPEKVPSEIHTHPYIYITVLGLHCRVQALKCSDSVTVMQTYLPHGMWDLSSLTRDQTCIPCIGRQIPHHWTTGKVPSVDLTGLSLAFQSHNVPPSHHSLPWGMASCVHTFLFC